MPGAFSRAKLLKCADTDLRLEKFLAKEEQEREDLHARILVANLNGKQLQSIQDRI